VASTRIAEILRILGEASEPLTSSDIAQMMGYARYNVSAQLYDLFDHGLVGREEYKTYRYKGYRYWITSDGRDSLATANPGTRKRFGDDGGCLLQQLWR
jgi:predicted transcriptional regulator